METLDGHGYDIGKTATSLAFIVFDFQATFKNFQTLDVFSFHILSLSLNFKSLYVFSFHILSLSLYFRCLCLSFLSLLVFSTFIVIVGQLSVSLGL